MVQRPTKGRTNDQIVDAMINGRLHWWPKEY